MERKRSKRCRYIFKDDRHPSCSIRVKWQERERERKKARIKEKKEFDTQIKEQTTTWNNGWCG